jgi:hypothetical protein
MMNLNKLQTKAGWIESVRQIAKQLPDQAAIQALTPIATPASATAEQIATKLNQLIAALKNVA